MSKTTISCDRDTLERFNELRNNAHPDDLPAIGQDQMLQTLMDTYEAIQNEEYGIEDSLNAASMAVDPTVDADAEQIIETLEAVKELVDRVPERTANRIREDFQ